MTKQIFYVILIAVSTIFVPGKASAQVGGGPVQVALTPQIQLLDQDASVNGFRLNLLYGRNRDVRWIDLGLANRADGSFDGLGVGVINSSGASVRGVTLGAWSAAELDCRGLQAGLLNTVGFDTYGGQWGLANWSDSLSGMQIGLFNHAWSAQGVQLGVVNITSHLKGVQIGLLNIVTDRYPWSAWPLISVRW